MSAFEMATKEERGPANTSILPRLFIKRARKGGGEHERNVIIIDDNRYGFPGVFAINGSDVWMVCVSECLIRFCMAAENKTICHNSL